MSKHIVIRRFVVAASSVCAFALIPGCLVESQKATDTFADGQMPKSLERLANQFHELANIVGLTDRVERESTDRSLLPVAIIDCGMDLAHPDLVQRIAFDIEQGHLTGAGFDFMGNDRWASANLVNPTFFAVGSDVTADNKLTNVNPEPLKYLSALNQEFMAELVTRVQADPILSQSLFKKLTTRSMTLIGAANYAQQSYNPKTYKQSDDEDSLIDVDTRERMAKDAAYAKKLIDDPGPAILAAYLDLPWVLDPKSGMPQTEFINSTSNVDRIAWLKHSDAFHALVVKTFADFDQKTGIVQKLANYKKFAALKADLIKPLTGEEYNDLSMALSLKVLGLKSLDPMKEFGDTLRIAAISDPRNSDKVLGRDLILNTQTYNDELDAAFSRYEEMLRLLENSNSSSASVLRDIANVKVSMGPMRELIQWYRQDRKLDSTLGANPKPGSPQESLYRRYLVRNSIPYLSEESANAAHGTHTAGIVAAQDPNIRIVPVRVITQGMVTNVSESEKAKSQFKQGFTDWLKSPLVFRALGVALKDLDDSDFGNGSLENRSQVATKLARSFSQKIDLEFEKQPLDFQFMDEVTQAIRFVGARKIKVANVSLGTSFSAVPASLSNLNNQQKLETLFDFLKFEFFKFEIGRAIRNFAPQTLFVVASGNEGQWVDGKSRSALPMDISSPFLAPFEDPAVSEVAPNNNLSNILAVGSVDPKGRLSSFTNILLGSKTPYVLAHGESILSPVKTTDIESVTQLIDAKVPLLLKPDFGPDSDRILKKIYESRVPNDVHQGSRFSAANKIENRYDDSVKTIKALGAAVQLHMFLKYPNHRARMSGTSMATPAVTGIMSRLIIEKAKRLGVSPQDIYDSPEFSPRALIDDMFKSTQPLGGSGGRGIAMSTLMNDVKNEPAQGAIDLEKALDQALTNGSNYKCLKPKSTTPDPFCN